MLNKNSLMHIPNNIEIIIQDENYAYLSPCDNLKKFISNFTITFPNRIIISDKYTVMPHASVTLVLFYFENELYSYLFGPTTKPVRVGNLANQCEIIFIIEFQPAGLYPFIKVKQNELTDKILTFSTIDESLDNMIREIFSKSITIDQLFHDLEEKLQSMILFEYPYELDLAIQVIIQKEGIISSIDIANKIYYSTRHLNRLFNHYIGMSMKSFSRLVRINKSFKLLDVKNNTLDIISEKLGYYDVSHFVKDFKIVSNITPQEYRMNMSDFYSEIAKF